MVVSQKLIARYAELKAEAPGCLLLAPLSPRAFPPFERHVTKRRLPGGKK